MLEKIKKYRRKAGVAELDTTAKPSIHTQQIYYYHTDHLGTPQELTDQDGHIVWSAQYQAWGRLHSIERPARLVTVQQGNTLTQSLVTVEQIEQPLRFQGQYHDSETGLHYNRYRYYDPDIGRFISQDPIGLLGGMNLYQYAPNPVGWVDPFGLCPDEVIKEIPISKDRYGEAAEHIADAQKAGHPDVLTIARDGASANRNASIGGLPKVPGKQLDEYPPAMFKEGGSGASVRAISPRDNMGAGACIGNACRGLSNGEKIRIKVVD